MHELQNSVVTLLQDRNHNVKFFFTGKIFGWFVRYIKHQQRPVHLFPNSC